MLSIIGLKKPNDRCFITLFYRKSHGQTREERRTTGCQPQTRLKLRARDVTPRPEIDTAKYTNTDPNRGRFSQNEPTFIGLQSYSNYSFPAAFRHIRVTVL